MSEGLKMMISRGAFKDAIREVVEEIMSESAKDAVADIRTFTESCKSEVKSEGEPEKFTKYDLVNLLINDYDVQCEIQRAVGKVSGGEALTVRKHWGDLFDYNISDDEIIVVEDQGRMYIKVSGTVYELIMRKAENSSGGPLR